MCLGRMVVLAALAFLSAGAITARGHTPSETFLTLVVSGTNILGQWEVALRDLEQGLGLPPERWQTLSAVEREQRREALAVDTVTRLEVQADGRRLGFRVTDLETVKLNAGEYERVKFAAATESGAATAIEINGRALFAVDTNMHGLLRVVHEGRTEAASFNVDHPTQAFSLAQPSARSEQLWTFVREGVKHIWHGPDHILFLIALLLPAAFRRETGGSSGAGLRSGSMDQWINGSMVAASTDPLLHASREAVRPTVLRILGIVTAFTLAHSITLSLAVVGVVRVPGRVVEPLIAASVAAAALNNLRPWFGGRGWVLAFAFGLVHGFGLATGLLEFGLRGAALALALVGFNAGVELGQAAIVAAFVPVVLPVAGTRCYRMVALRYGSVVVAMIAGVWMAERLFAFKVLPF